MDTLTELWNRLRVLFRRRQIDRDLEEEMLFHVEMRAQELVGGGMPEADRVHEVFEEVSDFHLRDPELARTYFKELIFLPSGESSRTDDFMRKYYDRLTALLLEAQDSGELRDDVPVAVLSRNLFAIWSSLMRRALAKDATADDVHQRLEVCALVNPQPDPTICSGHNGVVAERRGHVAVDGGQFDVQVAVM